MSMIAALGLSACIAAYFTYPQEGVMYVAYKDGSTDVWTIGRGHTRGVHEGMTATQEQVDIWYAEDYAVVNAAYARLVHAQLLANVEASGKDFIFNTGEGNFARSTLRKKFNARAFNRASACGEYPKWKYSGGKDCTKKSSNCAGVITRRAKEKELCLSDELVSCDLNSGVCEPVGIRPAQH